MPEVRLSLRLLAALAPKMSPFERWLFGMSVGRAVEREPRFDPQTLRRAARALVIKAGLPLFRSYVDRAEELLTTDSPETALHILAGGSRGH